MTLCQCPTIGEMFVRVGVYHCGTCRKTVPDPDNESKPSRVKKADGPAPVADPCACRMFIPSGHLIGAPCGCGARHSDGCVCTLDPTHEGDHEAHGGRVVHARWPRAEAKVLRVVEVESPALKALRRYNSATLTVDGQTFDMAALSVPKEGLSETTNAAPVGRCACGAEAHLARDHGPDGWRCLLCERWRSGPRAESPRPNAGPGWCACVSPKRNVFADMAPYICGCVGLLRPPGCRCHDPQAEPCAMPPSAPLGARAVEKGHADAG